MNRDFYATIAQVLPVLLLALVWDSRYLERLRTQPRRLRRVDPDGVLFWTKPRVRLYSIFVTAVLIGGIGVGLLVLADVLEDTVALRAVLVGVLVVGLVTLLVRISADVVDATREP